MARINVLTDKQGIIDEKLIVRVMGEEFTVWVVEEGVLWWCSMMGEGEGRMMSHPWGHVMEVWCMGRWVSFLMRKLSVLGSMRQKMLDRKRGRQFTTKNAPRLRRFFCHFAAVINLRKMFCGSFQNPRLY